MRRGRPVYCRNPADRERIAKRAASVGRTVSDFVMTCALHDGPDGASPASPALVLSAGEQRDLLRNARALRSRIAGLFADRADGGPSPIDAVTLLYHLHDGDLPSGMRVPALEAEDRRE